MKINPTDLPTGRVIQTGAGFPPPQSSDTPPAVVSSDTPATPIQENFFVKVGNGDAAPTGRQATPPNIDDDLISEDSTIAPDVYLLRSAGVGVCPVATLFPLANLSILKAQMKSGKTFVCSLFASAILAGTWENQVNATDPAALPAVIYIDTEQSPAATKRIRQRITKLCAIARDSYRAGEPYTRRDVTPDAYNVAADLLKNRLIVANVRKYRTADRLQHIDAILSRFCAAPASPVRFVVIDGVKDICEDFNNIAAVAATMDKLTAWALAYNVHILCVLHENPSSDKARGHLGTELYNKATEVINVERVADSFAVKWDAIRDGAGVTPLYFSISTAGDPSHPVPVYADAPDDTPDGNGDPAKGKGKGKGKGKTGETPVQKNTGGQRFRTQNK